jgi:hypothetical protein
MSEKPICPLRQRLLERHEHPQVRARCATRVYPSHQEARDFPSPFPRHCDGGRAERVPAASSRDRCSTTEHQRDRDRASVLFKVTFDRSETTRHLVFIYEPRKLPRVALARRGVAPVAGSCSHVDIDTFQIFGGADHLIHERGKSSIWIAQNVEARCGIFGATNSGRAGTL